MHPFAVFGYSPLLRCATSNIQEHGEEIREGSGTTLGFGSQPGFHSSQAFYMLHDLIFPAIARKALMCYTCTV
jgi:hypothetical protein